MLLYRVHDKLPYQNRHARLFVGLMTIFFACAIYQLTSKDKRRGWLWAGIYLASAMVLSQLTSLGGIADYIVFVLILIALFWVKPVNRNW